MLVVSDHRGDEKDPDARRDEDRGRSQQQSWLDSGEATGPDRARATTRVVAP